jgi:hypothetical protein
VSNLKVPAIPDPTENLKSLRHTTLALKEATEIMSGQRGPTPFVTWDDLVRLGLVSAMDVPRK